MTELGPGLLILRLLSRALCRWDRALSAVAGPILVTALILTEAMSVKAKEWRRVTTWGGNDSAGADVPACPAIRTVEVEVPTDATTIRIPRRTTAAVAKALLVLRGTLALAILLHNDVKRGASPW